MYNRLSLQRGGSKGLTEEMDFPGSLAQGRSISV
ncbi:hypothetical protein ABOUO_16 [Brevibacillus phage Abouo]|uniref:Uncharacterized protein n=2 Tax=Abouovirus TaxID=1984773 RepID=S5M6F5_9CAUD|nr:hypothetical protein DAVIES_16 [Brevibacillus phage Davies]YP_009220073.1 hypothetical protein AVV45_gp16 [Brevibacillus phage Abouo]AGR47522.1 hypothetical protein ABOUO_16 [Brevibacillus phage Abouo]AGR47626.1 hypothetical protein DAVIES_16 [Brevibacillus phage Davies]